MTKSRKKQPKASEIQMPLQSEYYSIEKISQRVHRLVKIKFEGGDVVKETIREDIPEMVRAKFNEYIYNAPLLNETHHAIH